MSWTDERIAALKKLWEGGATASQIAEELGGVSRNAVIGKAHRLSLKARPSPVKAGEKKAKPAAEPTSSEALDSKPVKESKVPAATAETAAKPQQAPSRSAVPQDRTDSAQAPMRRIVERAAEEESRAAPADDPAPVAQNDAAAPVEAAPAATPKDTPRIVSVGPGGFLRQGPGDQQPPIPPAPPRRLVPAKPSPEVADKTSLLELNDKVCRWPMGHPGEPDFHFCGEAVNPGFPYCVEHCGRAYQAQLPRGARRPPPPLPFGGPRVR